MYSNQELAEIHFMYGKADGNAALARRLYQERYPQRQCPDRKTFVRLHYRLCEYGKFNSPGLGKGRPTSTTPEVQEEILEAVNMTPSISTRRVALQVNVPHTTVWRLLKEYQLNFVLPYDGEIEQRKILSDTGIPSSYGNAEFLHGNILCTSVHHNNMICDTGLYELEITASVGIMYVTFDQREIFWKLQKKCSFDTSSVRLKIPKAECKIEKGYISVADVPEICPAGVILHASKSTDMSLSHLSTLKCHRPGPGSNPQPWTWKGSAKLTRQPGRLEFLPWLLFIQGVSEVVLQTFRDDGEWHMYQLEIRNHGREMTESKVISKNSVVMKWNCNFAPRALLPLIFGTVVERWYGPDVIYVGAWTDTICELVYCSHWLIRIQKSGLHILLSCTPPFH
ncbi:hypothetical protein ANN_24837 [Periplaneta americana]|uniref:DUF4817 domain-containing protein n=1 Tax=Periplaneta americana TaxID=6978 RepID=A0ABQ8S004_PERAM|nr:hypothetical protein ANN_24837 [Periplaneta americana]